MELLLNDVRHRRRPNDAYAHRDRESLWRRRGLSRFERDGGLRQSDSELRRGQLAAVRCVLAVVRPRQSDANAARDAKRRMRRLGLPDAERECWVQQRLLPDQLRANAVVGVGLVLVGLLGHADAHALDADARVRRRRAVRFAQRVARLWLGGGQLRRRPVEPVGRLLGALRWRLAHAHASNHGQPNVRRRRLSTAVGERRLQSAVLRHELRADAVVGLGRVLGRLLASDAIAYALDHDQLVRRRHTVRRQQREPIVRRTADRLRDVAVVGLGHVLAVVRWRFAAAHALNHDESELWWLGVWHFV